jgi:CRP-like cAMP-binding protein
MKNMITSERPGDRLLKDILLELVPGLPPTVASSLANAPKIRKYDSGDLIIREGEASTGIFLLVSGTVQAVVSKRASEARRQVSLHQIMSPAVLGLAAAMLTQPSGVSILALTPTETAFIPRAGFLHVLEVFPKAALAFSQVIANELAHTYSHLSQLRSNRRSPNAPAPTRLILFQTST